MTKENLDQILNQLFEDQAFIQAVLSGPRPGEESQKIVIRPLLLKEKLFYQLTEFRGPQAFHHNLEPQECLNVLISRLSHFKQSFLYTSKNDYQILVGKKGNFTILKKPPSKRALNLSHNRLKQYVLEEGIPVPFLIELGVMNQQGKVYPQKRDKFRQINRFLEMIEDVLPHLDQQKKIQIVDFGCGKAYLTFALYHYLKIEKRFKLNLIGLDLKQDVIEKCQVLADTLGYTDLKFALGDINQYQTNESVDMVVSLHACDTATDAALEKAIRWQTKVILCVPCCQHELFKQVQNEALQPILKQGILKERFAALVTDAARAQLLEVLGYQTQVLEFIDVEHTPKNLLIRAVKREKIDEHDREKARQIYLEFKQDLKINPSLERRFKERIEA